MLYQIKSCVDKSKDWKIVSIEGVDGVSASDVSVNRVNKKNEIFPNFDLIQSGKTVEATLWMSPAGKAYLFAPAPFKSQNSASSGGVKAAIAEKSKSIAIAQENKAEGIMLSSTIRMAVDIVVARGIAGEDIDTASIKAKILNWRKWLVDNWDNTIADGVTSAGTPMPDFGDEIPF